MAMLIAGVDDAGRGSIMGPLVIGGVVFKKSQIPKLKEFGVRDSKALTTHRRATLVHEVKRLAVRWAVFELRPSEVDEVVFRGKKFHRLNWLEATAMAKVIMKLRPEIAYVDASDINVKRFAKQIKEVLPFEVKIISEHHADANYAVVSAASIVAKVHRDEAVDLLRQKYGDFGSGYPSDQRTINFLSKWLREKREVPDFVRKSWKTIKRLEGKKESDDTE